MRANEFTTEEILDEIPSSFVNQMVDKKQWSGPSGKKDPPKGQTASVWQHISDPDTVVKLVGGGVMQDLAGKHKRAAIAFVEFLVDHGKESIHLPIVHGINVDDPEVVQIRMEALYPIKGRYLKYALERLSDSPNTLFLQEIVDDEINAIKGSNKQNTGEGIARCCRLLNNYAATYAKKYGLKKFVLDLHEDNWMMDKNGIIVAVDPWFAGW